MKTDHMICVNIINILLDLPCTYHVLLLVRSYLMYSIVLLHVQVVYCCGWKNCQHEIFCI